MLQGKLAILLAVIAAHWAPAALFGAQLQSARIGVLTPGGSFAPVLAGLRQGLAQLGYAEGKQVNFIVEDTEMETLDPVRAALKLLKVNRDLSSRWGGLTRRRLSRRRQPYPSSFA